MNAVKYLAFSLLFLMPVHGVGAQPGYENPSLEGAPCEEDRQCGSEDFKCIGGVCGPNVCPTGYEQWINESTLEHTCKKLGGYCESDELCENDESCEEFTLVGYPQCTKLECYPHQHPENHSCVEHECLLNIECSGDERCLNYSCVRLDCKGDEYIANHTCKKIECGYCQYLSNRTCVDYECCDNTACKNDEHCLDHGCVSLSCKGDETIEDHECVRLRCPFGQYADNHQCVSYWSLILDFINKGVVKVILGVLGILIFIVIVGTFLRHRREKKGGLL